MKFKQATSAWAVGALILAAMWGSVAAVAQEPGPDERAAMEAEARELADRIRIIERQIRDERREETAAREQGNERKAREAAVIAESLETVLDMHRGRLDRLEAKLGRRVRPQVSPLDLLPDEARDRIEELEFALRNAIERGDWEAVEPLRQELQNLYGRLLQRVVPPDDPLMPLRMLERWSRMRRELDEAMGGNNENRGRELRGTIEKFLAEGNQGLRRLSDRLPENQRQRANELREQMLRSMREFDGERAEKWAYELEKLLGQKEAVPERPERPAPSIPEVMRKLAELEQQMFEAFENGDEERGEELKRDLQRLTDRAGEAVQRGYESLPEAARGRADRLRQEMQDAWDRGDFNRAFELGELLQQLLDSARQRNRNPEPEREPESDY